MSTGRKMQLSRGQRFEQLEKQVKQLEMAVRIGQMLQQQMNNSLTPLQTNLRTIAPQIHDIQYRLLAAQELLGLDSDALSKKADEIRLKDYTEASDKEDLEHGYTNKEVVDTESDMVIITSSTPDEEKDRGIFRSKILVSDTGPDLAPKFVGKKIGDTIEHVLDNTKHIIEILGVRDIPAPVVENESVDSIPPIDTDNSEGVANVE